MLPRRALMNDKIVSAQGENLSLVNVKGSKLNALSVYGKSTQSGTPSPENPVPIVSAGDSGEININVGGKNLVNIGTVTFDKSKIFAVNIPVGTYTFSAEVESDDTDSKICLVMFRKNKQNIGTLSVFRIGRSSATITLNENADEILLYASAGFNESDGDTATFTDIQLEIGTVATAYEPYKTPQTLTLSTPGGLPGIPVSSGGNYTDESGQQWVCDEIDLKCGKYVKRVGEVELSGTESYTLGENNGRYYYHIESESFTNFPLTTMSGWSTKGLCTHFQYNNPYSFEGDAAVCLNQNGTNKVRIGFADNINDVEYVKSYVLEQKNTGNPVRLYFVLESPIETDLPAEEIAAYKALHTYSPTTTVTNDAEAWMEVGYREYRR